MTFEQLDTHIKRYLVYLNKAKAIKDMGSVDYKITYSKKSRSFYVRLFIVANNEVYKKTLRFSDHPYQFNGKYPQKMRGVVLKASKEFSKKEIKFVEATLRKEIKKLQYCAHMQSIYKFKPETS